jgi:hypothetical protein
MKGHVSYERAPLCGIYIQALFPHLKSSHSYHILIQLLLNMFTSLKWIIAYYPIYIGYLHSEPAWFTTHNYSSNLETKVATYHLHGKASLWWDHLKQVKNIDENMITWKQFQEVLPAVVSFRALL